MIFSELMLPNDSHAHLTSANSALSVIAEPRLCFTDIPLFWNRDDVLAFIRILMLHAILGITSIKIGQKDNRKMAFVTVRDMALAEQLMALSNTRQGHVGAERPVGIFLANEPGKCSKCRRTGHSGKQCKLCGTCQSWGHSALLCPEALARRPPPAIASSSNAPQPRPTLSDEQQPPPDFLLRANNYRAALRAPAHAGLAAAFPPAPAAPPPPPPRAHQPPPPPTQPAPQAPRAYQPPPPPPTAGAVAVGTVEWHAATAARLDIVWTDAARLNALLVNSDPASLRSRCYFNSLAVLLAEADDLEAQVLASQQIHPPG
jgi:hypothetical protein